MPTRSTTAGALGRGSGAIKLMSTTNLFDLLANEFSVDDLRDLYRDKNRKDITGGALRNTLSKWRQQGLITDTERRGVYRKCEIMLKWRCICDVYAMYMRYRGSECGHKT